MIIYVENQIFEYENRKDNVDKIIQKIYNIVSNNSKVFSYMIIDGIEVYDNFYEYILDNINVIEKVEVITQTYKELVNSVLVSTINYIERIQSRIEELANSFYKKPSQSSWKDLQDLLDGITWIMNSFAMIDQDNRLRDLVPSYESWNLYAMEVFSLKELLSDFEEALLNKDYVSIADILSYELVSIFKGMNVKLLTLVSREDGINDIN